MQHIIKEESSGDSPKEEGIVKFAFADVHLLAFAFDSVLEYFKIGNKVSTKERYPYEGEFED